MEYSCFHCFYNSATDKCNPYLASLSIYLIFTIYNLAVILMLRQVRFMVTKIIANSHFSSRMLQIFFILVSSYFLILLSHSKLMYEV